MAEVGQKMQATVLRVMPYGAIVQLEDGTVGLVHISEIANRYVEDINEYCSEGARVLVVVLCRKPDARWEFSMKQLVQNAGTKLEAPQDFGSAQPMFDAAMPHHPPPRPVKTARERAAFDEKMRDFLSDSSERIEDVRRHHDHRLGGRRR